MIREEFITASEVGLERLLAPLKDLPDELMDESISEARWSAKQTLIHILYWNTQVLLALELLYRGEHYDWESIGNINEINAREVAKRASEPYKRISSELRITHSTLMAAIELIPVEHFGKDGELPEWLPEIVCEHYAHHTPLVAKWAKKIRESGRGGSAGLPVLG